MKLHFDSKQEFQLEAVKSITDIFEGQPLCDGDKLKTNTVIKLVMRKLILGRYKNIISLTSTKWF